MVKPASRVPCPCLCGSLAGWDAVSQIPRNRGPNPAFPQPGTIQPRPPASTRSFRAAHRLPMWPKAMTPPGWPRPLSCRCNSYGGFYIDLLLHRHVAQGPWASARARRLAPATRCWGQMAGRMGWAGPAGAALARSVGRVDCATPDPPCRRRSWPADGAHSLARRQGGATGCRHCAPIPRRMIALTPGMAAPGRHPTAGGHRSASRSDKRTDKRNRHGPGRSGSRSCGSTDRIRPSEIQRGEPLSGSRSSRVARFPDDPE